jgi:hypothetical protein
MLWPPEDLPGLAYSLNDLLLDDLRELCQAGKLHGTMRHCTFDGIAIHWYGGKSFSLLTSWWNTEHTGLTGGFDDFKPFVESAKKFNLPIYLTGKASTFRDIAHC